MTRKSITERVEQFSVYDFDGSLSDAIAKLVDLRERHGDQVRLDAERDYYDGSVDIVVYRTRPETDDEMNARKRRAARAAETRRKNREKRLLSN